MSAGPQEVWDLVTDLANMGRWSPENDGEMAQRWRTKLGARFMGKTVGKGTSGLPRQDYGIH